jgi:NAD(P)-dependent dehydrogenase (short-subunit alcohol dehydrogenase family)
MKRVALVTGAATGIGRACADLLHAEGWQVFGVSRAIEQANPPPTFTHQNCDVTDEAALSTLVTRITTDAGRLDAVINCAGYVLAGAFEDTTHAEALRQFNTNYFGAANVCRAVLPLLRQQRSGVIVNIGSIAGQVPMAFQAHYSASKAALTALTRALRLELLPFGVHVVIVEPGDFATAITSRREQAREQLPAYADTYTKSLAVIRRDELAAQPPSAVAKLVLRLVTTRDPSPSALVGPWLQRFAVRVRPLVPARFFDWVLRQLYALG